MGDAPGVPEPLGVLARADVRTEATPGLCGPMCRRRRRLARGGAAWISAAPGPAVPLAGAVVDVTCAAGQVTEVARALAENPRVAGVHLASGTWDLFALLVAQDLANLSALLVATSLPPQASTAPVSGRSWSCSAAPKSPLPGGSRSTAG